MFRPKQEFSGVPKKEKAWLKIMDIFWQQYLLQRNIGCSYC